MPRLLASLLLLGLVGAAACGEAHRDDPRVYVRTLSVDGPPPGALRAVRLELDGPRESYPLQPVDGDDPALYVAVGAPRGAYMIEGEGGWSMLTSGRPIPLEPDGSAPSAQLGHPHTLYLGAAKETQRPSTRWGVQTVPTADQPSQVREVELLREPPYGYVVAIRFPPETWTGEMEAVGYLVEGPPGVAPELETLGNLAEPVRFTARDGGRPVLAQVKAALTAPLSVTLVPATPDTPVDDVSVRVELADVPIDARYELETERSLARFGAVADIGKELKVSTPPHESAFTLDERRWHDIRDMYLLALRNEDAREARVRLPEGAAAELDAVLVRGRDSPAFGLVPFTVSGDEAVIRVPRSEAVVLLRSGSKWARVALEASEDPSLTEAPAFEQGVTVQGQVSGDFRGATVLMFRQEGEEAVIGNGLVLRVSLSGRFHGMVPPGTYHVEVHSPRGTWKRSAPVPAERAGGQVHLNLRAP